MKVKTKILFIVIVILSSTVLNSIYVQFFGSNRIVSLLIYVLSFIIAYRGIVYKR